jgi:hypothetical protein
VVPNGKLFHQVGGLALLTYHPALDAYHAAFRIVRILVARNQKPTAVLQARILDFYLLFPALIPSIKLPREALSYRKTFRGRENKYWFSGDPAQTFKKLEPVQGQAIYLLYSKGVLDTGAFETGTLLLSPESVSSKLVERATAANKTDEVLMGFLGGVLAELTLTGSQGLKARTGLAESRYDAA